jgi:hypothetical protein
MLGFLTSTFRLLSRGLDRASAFKQVSVSVASQVVYEPITNRAFQSSPTLIATSGGREKIQFIRDVPESHTAQRKDEC